MHSTIIHLNKYNQEIKNKCIFFKEIKMSKSRIKSQFVKMNTCKQYWDTSKLKICSNFYIIHFLLLFSSLSQYSTVQVYLIFILYSIKERRSPFFLVWFTNSFFVYFFSLLLLPAGQTDKWLTLFFLQLQERVSEICANINNSSQNRKLQS